MKCPHCLEAFFPEYLHHDLQLIPVPGRSWPQDPDGHWRIAYTTCSSCSRRVISLYLHTAPGGGIKKELQVWPRGTARAPVPPEVPQAFAEDYREACLVLPDSAKASAAISRRCLQHLLRETARVKRGDLAEEIQDVLDAGKLPSDLAGALDAVRTIGNFAAHPVKSKSTGEIVEVEPGEAEWLLETLEALFDFYFVRPAKLAAKRDALNKKLAEAGKPPLKNP